ncbi:MAG: phenylalanine--tRNA ligase subunit alpha [Deltaproteobacteria bacterium]|nr:phenylalanine--tRNA ligase subunit alpha [Deltaproteobacteria bacterium]
MLQELGRLEALARAELTAITTAEELQALRVRFLGRKGLLTTILRQMGTVPAAEKPLVGRRANDVKAMLEASLDAHRETLAHASIAAALTDRLDMTLPGRRPATDGHEHPIRQMTRRVLAICTDLGFSIFDGPEVESEQHNFEALNMPADHPARDMQDTLYVEAGACQRLLRTHTSPVQIRVMLAQPPPVRIVAPGAVFRRDADVTHSPMFHQVEGLYVDHGVTFQHLKGTLLQVLERLFGEGISVRFRPSFFPFTEPSAEIDLGYHRDAHGMRLARHGAEPVTDWLEILGCGMVDPAVFEAVGYDATAVSGFAFGLGIERLAMLEWGIDDIRRFYENDLRFLTQL